MGAKNRGKPLDPEATRNAILEAALTRLAETGPEGINHAAMARLAQLDRGTIYRHFETRDELIQATLNRVSDKLLHAVFGEDPRGAEPRDAAEIMERNSRLLKFGMENPELCRIWLFQVLASADPASDPFWKDFEGSYAAFARTEAAQENLNSEVLAVIMLASVFLWPIWVGAQAKNERQKQELATSFLDESLRLSMYGSLRPEYFPEIAAKLKGGSTAPKRPGGAKTAKAAQPEKASRLPSAADGAGRRTRARKAG